MNILFHHILSGCTDIQVREVTGGEMILSFFVIASCFQGIFPNDTIVTLPNGRIQGFVSKSFRHGKTFYSFIGIPYAAPPIKNLRFQPPQSVANWNGVLSTKAATKTCLQMEKKAATDSEDCLYLSVFTPVRPGSPSSLPVMVEIHGGGFVQGYGANSDLKPQNFIEKDIVVVSINYRLGPLGFLSTGDTVIPGNMGLKDQQFALKWVQKNIHLFGGDPRKVTIIGQSAGAASVTYQILSPGSAGLFRAVIAQSSSALSTYAHQSNPAEVAYEVAAGINHNFTRKRSTEELHDFLLTVPASTIMATKYVFGRFSPVIEVPHAGAFITKPMHEMVKQGVINKVPLLIGHCSEEEIGHLSDLASWTNTAKNLVPRNLVRPELNLKDKSKQLIVGEKIKDIYTNGTFEQHLGKAIQNLDSGSSGIIKLITVRLLSDTTFIRSTIRFAELASHHMNVYYYQFSFQGEIRNNGLSNEGVSGVAHAEDVWYLWTYFRNYSVYPEADVKTVDRYVGLFTNFAKYLNPIPKKDGLFNVILPKMSHDDMYYLDIRKDLEVKKNPRQFSYQKWVQLFEGYGKPPFTSF